jgi:hypothetical protein
VGRFMAGVWSRPLHPEGKFGVPRGKYGVSATGVEGDDKTEVNCGTGVFKCREWDYWPCGTTTLEIDFIYGSVSQRYFARLRQQ